MTVEIKQTPIRPWFSIRPFLRHSLVLLVAGMIYIGTGLSYMFTESSLARDHALTVALEYAPLKFWGLFFVIAGVLGIMSSRWPPASETWGYIWMSSISGGWGCVYLMGILFKHSRISNISGVFVWGLLAFLWWAISGLRNPTVIIIRREE